MFAIASKMKCSLQDLAIALETNLKSLIFLLLVCVLALVQMVYQLTLPGPYYDEAYHTVYAIWILTDKPVLWGPPFAYTILGLPVLGSLGYYAGPFESYMAFLPMTLFGINVPAVRIVPILLTIGTLPFVYFLMRNRFGVISAYATAVLFAVQPSLLLWSRVGLYPFSILVFLTFSSLYCFNRWLLTRTLRWLVVGSFLLGLGFETFISFTWYILALIVATILMRIDTHVRIRHIPLVAISFLAGVGPYLIPWVTGENINFFVNHAATSYSGVSNLTYAQNLVQRISQFGILVEGSGFSFYGGVHSNPLATILFAASWVGTLLLIILSRSRLRNDRKPHLFPFVVFTSILLQTPVTIASLSFYQLLPLLPFSLMLEGCFFAALWNADRTILRSVSTPRIRPLLRSCRILLLLALSLSIVLDLSTTAAYQADLRKSGGVDRWTDATYQAADYLVSRNCPYVLAVDWGLSWGLLLASGGRLSVRDIFWVNGEEFKIVANRYIDTAKDSCFISWRVGGSWNRLEVLQETVRDRIDSLVLEKTFYQRDGTPVIDIYRIANDQQSVPNRAPATFRNVIICCEVSYCGDGSEGQLIFPSRDSFSQSTASLCVVNTLPPLSQPAEDPIYKRSFP